MMTMMNATSTTTRPTAALLALLMLLAAGRGGGDVHAFVLPSSSTTTAANGAGPSIRTPSCRAGTSQTILHSTRQATSPYDPVASSGPSWNGQRWEGQARTFQQEFDRNRERQQEGRPYFPTPQQQPAAPMVRYSDLSERERESLGGGATSSSYYGRSTSSLGYDMAPLPPPPAVELPMNSKDIQGGSRGTWSSDGRANHDQVQVTMTTDGRPLSCDVEVYQGPDNTPQRMRIFSEDGRRRPFTTIIQTPQGAAKTSSLFYNPYNLRDSASSSSSATSMAAAGGTSHSISIINRGPMEFPISAGVEGIGTTDPEERAAKMADYSGRARLHGKNEEIHGGHLKTYPFDPSVASVEVRIQSQGLPIMAVVELWQGPGDVKTVAQVYCDDGRSKPFSAIIETPGSGNTIAIRNVGPTAYPIEAILDVYSVDNSAYSYRYPTSSFANNGSGNGNTDSNGMPFFGRY